MYQVITYFIPDGYIVLKETNDFEEAKNFFDKITPEEKLAGETINNYELVESKNNVLNGIAKKSDSVLKIERRI